MNNITLKQVYSALCGKIEDTYPEKEIYGSSVHQNLAKGSFNVIPISVTDMTELSKRVKRKATFDCIYYSDDYEDMLDIADKFPLSIATIKTDNGQLLHGFFNTPTTEITDDAVHCIVSYEYFGVITEVIPEGEESETDLMYYLKQNFIEVKQ